MLLDGPGRSPWLDGLSSHSVVSAFRWGLIIAGAAAAGSDTFMEKTVLAVRNRLHRQQSNGKSRDCFPRGAELLCLLPIHGYDR
jgi:hypothetical protein